MLPELRQDRSALRWIRGELDQTLREARNSLEDFIEGRQPNVDPAVDLLHHVHGALDMVQVYGAAMLADEMEQLAAAIAQGRVNRVEPAAEALMLGLVQLPAYLEKLENGGADVPLALLPLMNDLRSARDAPLVSETSLFAPKLDAVIAAETVRPGSGNRDLPRLVQQQRSRYHRGLLNWIRNQSVESSLAQLRGVLGTIHQAAGTVRFRRLLGAAEALAAALMDHEEAPALAVKPLFGKLDRVFKLVIDQGEESAMLDFPVDLLKNLLYYVARSNSSDPAVVAVKHSADLANSFPESLQDTGGLGSLGAPDRALFDAVGEALAVDLRDVKDQLDLFIRSDRGQLERLTRLAQPIQRIGDTLGMVGRGDMRTRLKHRCDELQNDELSEEVRSDDWLMSLAADLLFVESSLGNLADGGDQGAETQSGDGPRPLSQGELQQHMRAAIDEALVELAKTKDAILEYLDKPTETDLLNDVPARLHMVAGVCQLLDLPEAGGLLTDLKPYIAALASGSESVPDAPQRDAIADVVISAELYMQSAVEPGNDRSKLLRFAGSALERLGLRGAEAQPEVSVAEAEAEAEAEANAEVVSDDTVAELEMVDSSAPPAEESDMAAEAVPAVDTEPLATEAVAPSEPEAQPVPEPESVEPEPVQAASVPPAAAVDADDSVVDPEILEIFGEEADEELQVIQDCYPKWHANPDDREPLLTMRRSFHTLKGSGRIVGAMNIGEFAWSVENLLNRVIDGTVPVAPSLLSLMDDVLDALPTLVDEAKQPGGPDTDVSALAERAFAMASGNAAPAPAAAPAAAATPQIEAVEDLSPADELELEAEPIAFEVAPLEAAEEATYEPTAAVEALDTAGLGVLELDDEQLMDEVPEISFEPVEFEAADDADSTVSIEVTGEIPALDVTPEAEQPAADGQPETVGHDVLEESILTAIEVQDSEFSEADLAAVVTADSSLNAVFLNEAQGHLQVLADFVEHCRQQPEHREFDEGIRRAMHTLRGSSRTAGVEPMAELAGGLEQLSNLMHDTGRQADDAMVDLLDRNREMLTDLAVAVEDPHHAVSGWEPLRDEVTELVARLAHPAPNLEAEAEAASELTFDVASEPSSAVEGVDALSEPLPLADSVDEVSEPLPVVETIEVANEPLPSTQAPAAPVVAAAANELDPELTEIFLEEARELLESLESQLAEWERAVGDTQPVAKLQRTLHTMKGGARLAGVMTLGDLSHALESAFESVVERRIGDSDRLKQLVRHATDAAAQDVDLLARGSMPAAHPDLIERLEAAAHGRDWQDLGQAPSPAPQVDAESALTPQVDVESALLEESESLLQPETEASFEPDSVELDAVDTAFETESVLQPLEAGDEQLQDFADEAGSDSELLTDSQLLTDSELLADSGVRGPGDAMFTDIDVARDSTVVQFPGGEQLSDEEGFVPRRPLPDEPVEVATASERVRVASDALDQMVNNAGEVSIYRARIEQQNSSFAFNLNELHATIDRLRSQLRDLEIETEAQVLSRHEREGEARADFDPLELDRYSTIQQLSRALSETVEDLSNLGQSLIDLSRDTDTLLLQQARVTTDLQDSLLRTRMVKFSSRVPRLERVVRQTSLSVGKQANLDVAGGEEDMDRAILERMMGPLEHLLRNAVSHGIEDTNARLANSKPAQGLITLQLAREGTDVVLTLSDDGAGLDRARIRAKAIERGLLDSDAAVDDDDLFQFILQPGFSTAQELSQVSGRGVGMDVVLTEVKQLGGTLEIDSQHGHGTSFTIRLPFTLAISDALLVTLGDDIYAVPHSSMDGVVRIGTEELRAIYAGEQNAFHYGGRDYVVRYLGSMLGTHPPHLAEGMRWMPLLLVRSGEHRVAIQVDSLLGNRQIVVKSVGAQLSTVRWFTGGTILADGQIALILDTNSLVRIDSTQQQASKVEAVEEASKGVTVMVVDDSITVRKVTSRLLERHNMQVVTAKDGVDAVTLLQEHRPDVMLLDIEMPRMDGYELARHMRSTPELSDIPIIMITSRTGDKHRNRALELGVKRYLGKPYQEAELLENIYTVLADAAL